MATTRPAPKTQAFPTHSADARSPSPYSQGRRERFHAGKDGIVTGAGSSLRPRPGRSAIRRRRAVRVHPPALLDRLRWIDDDFIVSGISVRTRS